MVKAAWREQALSGNEQEATGRVGAHDRDATIESHTKVDVRRIRRAHRKSEFPNLVERVEERYGETDSIIRHVDRFINQRNRVALCCRWAEGYWDIQDSLRPSRSHRTVLKKAHRSIEREVRHQSVAGLDDREIQSEAPTVSQIEEGEAEGEGFQMGVV
jgi:hypothetical protein